MEPALTIERLDETALGQLAQRLAPRLRAGDFLALRGDLGAGKTAFARALIRALAGRPDEEVPSPTFSIVQPYETPRFPVHHFDFYRLSGPGEAAELGLDEALDAGLVVAEWPERLENRLPLDRLEIALTETDAPELRFVTLSGFGGWTPRLARFAAIERFLDGSGWLDARQQALTGDASARGYTRLTREGVGALLMDSPKMPDGPPIRDGRPYSQIAHLAEDVRPFVAVAAALREAGLAAPEILAQDLDNGLLLIEDFGDLTFTHLQTEGRDLRPLYRLAVDALLRLRQHPPAAILHAPDVAHPLPDFDAEALHIETELLTDWFLPAVNDAEPPQAVREEFTALWAEQFGWLLAQPAGWVLRDFHSPNLLLRPEQTGLARLGVIDFQDAMRGHPAYDLVSLLQDARLDLPAGLEDELLAHYCNEAAAANPAFDQTAFMRAYRLLGAQRATKILGIFTRLARRDGKRAYLRHMPRISAYLAADLADPNLAPLQAWYARHAPLNIEEIAARI
ncbi:MAG: tRNA (adenosine(37)-N6)-threonylcarbamoyltransferase complex ATPase subunit type 1 TsaE [Rhodomicrobiaceae bacterium]